MPRLRQNVITLPLTDDELRRLDELVERLKKKGVGRVSRSGLVRYAILAMVAPKSQISLDRLRTCKHCGDTFAASWPNSAYCSRCPAPGGVPLKP